MRLPVAPTTACQYGGGDLGEFAADGAGWRAALQVQHGGGCPASVIAFRSLIDLPHGVKKPEHRPRRW
jgi:hypothetical protein